MKMLLFMLYNLFIFISQVDSNLRLIWPKQMYPPFDFLPVHEYPKGECGVDMDTYDITKYPVTTVYPSNFDYIYFEQRRNHSERDHVRIYLIEGKKGADGKRKKHVLTEKRKGGFWNTIAYSDETSIFAEDEANLALPNCNPVCFLQVQMKLPDYGKRTYTRSCAAIKIEATAPNVKFCKGSGYIAPGGKECYCKEGRLGYSCDMPRGCELDSKTDCNFDKDQGRCVTMEHYEMHDNIECFCRETNYGKNCEKRNRFEIGAETKPDFSKYYTVDLNQNHKLYWLVDKVNNGTAEVIVKFKVYDPEAWVAFGWRSKDVGIESYKFPEGNYTPVYPSLVGMACSDIVIGNWYHGHEDKNTNELDGPYHRVRDYYVQAQSTPVLDEDLGGEDNLDSAVMWTEKENGADYTYLRIRKKVGPSIADVSFQGNLHFIWAMNCIEEKLDKKESYKKFLYYHSKNENCRGSTQISAPAKCDKIAASFYWLLIVGANLIFSKLL